jgi:predicted helicase
VAIGIFVKAQEHIKPARVWHADLWGVQETEDKRGGKYPWLFQHDLSDTPWQEISPQPPLYLFKPRKRDAVADYEKGWSIQDVMPSNSMGVTTGVDSFAAAFTLDELKKRVSDLAGKEDDAWLRNKYSLVDTSSFSLSKARQWATAICDPRASERKHGQTRRGRIARLMAESLSVVPIGYRCFDNRFVIYSSSVLARSRENICDHLILGANQALVTFRAIRKLPWAHVFLSDRIATKEYVSTLDNSYLFPLYLYKGEPEDQASLGVEISTWPAGRDGRRPNLNPEFVEDLKGRLGLSFVSDGNGDLKNTFGPQDVFSYIYAVFHSPAYRTRYSESLKSDFPRVPLTSDPNLFRVLCSKGAELVAVHLLESPKLGKPVARYPVKGSDVVDKGFPKYVAPGEPEPGTGKPLKEGRVYVNKEQHFEGVPPEVWNFHIGGYQVCEKWLKDRRGRKLSSGDLEHYRKVVTAIKETIRLMAEIDAAIPKWPIV